MVIKRASMKSWETDACHDGKGHLACIEMFTQYEKKDAGFKYVHDDILAPGASIGEHRHGKDEEIYLILDGEGTMIVDGAPQAVGAGDIILTRPGHTHGLINGPGKPMRLLVVCANV